MKRKDPSILQSLGLNTKRPRTEKPTNSVSLVEKRMALLSSLSASQASRELLSACRAGDLSRVEYLLKSVPSTDINYRSSASEDILGKGALALHYAALGDHVGIINFLCDCGASVLATTDSGLTALHVAAKRGHPASARALLAVGGPLLKVSKDLLGKTALWHASRGTLRGHQDVAKILK